jgi:excisionase family DNA binding protein
MNSRDVATGARSMPEMQMRHPEQQQLFDPDPLIDKEGSARCLGVEQRFINRLVSEKRITYVKVCRKIRFRQSTIEALLSAVIERFLPQSVPRRTASAQAVRAGP